MNNQNLQEASGDEEESGVEEDYYGSFARRVYFMADVEGWNQKKIVHYFNNMQAFEKYYNNVSVNESLQDDVKNEAVLTKNFYYNSGKRSSRASRTRSPTASNA